jgi:enoyl-CoA hydratase/carnithine racemase
LGSVTKKREVSALEYVKVEHEGEVAVLTVDRQDALNALNPQVQRELIEALTELKESAVS